MSRPMTKDEWQNHVADTFSLVVRSTYQDMIDEAVKAEREACARLCDKQAQDLSESDHWTGCASYLANKIRRRK